MAFYFSRPNSGVQPYLFNAQSLTTSPSDITVYLQDVFTTAPTKPITAGPFTMTTTTKQDPTTLPYKVVIPASSTVWRFDNTPIRTGVSSDWTTFLLALETQGLKSGRLQLIMQAVSQFMPLTFAETLLYRYGFDPVSGFIDLQPGMRLRVDYQLHQSVDPTTNALNGFIGTGTSYIEVNSFLAADGSLQTGFNPFLARLQSTAVAANQGGAAGPIDLAGQAYAYPYFRLFYPKNFPSSDSTGYAGTLQNVTLMGAKTLSDIGDATKAYLTTGNLDNKPVIATFFRGRATVTPEIPIIMQGQVRYVAVGTTIRHLMQGMTDVPYLTGVNVKGPSQFFSRWLANQITYSSPTLNWSYPNFAAVTLSTGNGGAYVGGYQSYTDTLDSFDLPVLGGDNLTLSQSGFGG